MALPAKKKSGPTAVEKGKGLTKTKLNRPVGGLSKDQMKGPAMGGDTPDEVAKVAKPKAKKGKPKSGGTGLY